jgi:hypothetical protein
MRVSALSRKIHRGGEVFTRTKRARDESADASIEQ